MMYTATMSYRNIYLPFRQFCTAKQPPVRDSFNDWNKVYLASVMESIYNEEWKKRGVYPYLKRFLQMVLNSCDTYTLSTIDCYVFKISEHPQIISNILDLECKKGFLWVEECYQGNDDQIAVFQCREPVELFLITAFSQLLLRRICDVYEAPITTYVSTLDDLRCKHYEYLNRQRNVVKLIKIDLSPCIKHVRNTRILSLFENKKYSGIVYNIVKQVLFLPIYDVASGKIISNNLVPPMGEITNVIFHHFFQIVFDQVLEDKYPGITYSRWGYEVFIAIKQKESFTFEHESVIALLDSIDLAADFYVHDCGDPGCLPASGGEKAVLLHDNGDVAVWRFEDI